MSDNTPPFPKKHTHSEIICFHFPSFLIFFIIDRCFLFLFIYHSSHHNKSISSLDHCYKKVYKNELNKELIRNEKINKKLLDLGEPKSPYFTKEKAEADAAEEARRQCIK